MKPVKLAVGSRDQRTGLLGPGGLTFRFVDPWSVVNFRSNSVFFPFSTNVYGFSIFCDYIQLSYTVINFVEHYVTVLRNDL